MDPTGGVVMGVLAQQAKQAIAQSTLVEKVRDGVVCFLAERAKSIGGQEIEKRIDSLRSDAHVSGISP